jgi:SAM-dependent methyltransferase
MTTPKPWYEEDDFWENWESFMFSKEMVARAATEIDQILKLADLKPGSRVLDLPCGVGRHSLELARRGFNVTGVDRSPEFLDKARQAAGSEGLDAEFTCQDMRQFVREGGFDAILNIGGSFAYFENPDDDRRVAENYFKSLKSGGVLVLDTVGKEVIARNFLARDWEERDGVFFLQERRIVGDWESVEGRWVLFQNGKLHEARTNVRLYSASELKALLLECGFGEVKALGSLEGTAYDTEAHRLEVVARKG